jgi:acyl-CoA reductase-like NAD-dependent aldehyde dehydrogenase
MMGYGLEDGAARGIDEEVIFQPLGVFAAITPFNFPFMIAFWFMPYAVATGNTFILKPSEQDPMVQQRVFELIDQVGFPPGVVNLVNGGRMQSTPCLTIRQSVAFPSSAHRRPRHTYMPVHQRAASGSKPLVVPRTR